MYIECDAKHVTLFPAIENRRGGNSARVRNPKNRIRCHIIKATVVGVVVVVDDSSA